MPSQREVWILSKLPTVAQWPSLGEIQSQMEADRPSFDCVIDDETERGSVDHCAVVAEVMTEIATDYFSLRWV